MKDVVSRFVSAMPSLALLIVIAAIGCGGGVDVDLGEVSGKVTLDGQPLANATVQFQPQNGRPSSGTTDADGNYELNYSGTTMGALVGKHSVSISTYRPASGDEEAEDEESEPFVPEVPEKVPAQYNSESQETREVASGANEFDFEMTSGGEIKQPDGDDGDDGDDDDDEDE